MIQKIIQPRNSRRIFQGARFPVFFRAMVVFFVIISMSAWPNTLQTPRSFHDPFPVLGENSIWGMPSIKDPKQFPGLKIAQHAYYSVGYSTKNHIPNWVLYELSASNTIGDAERESRFIADPLLFGETAITEDYKNTGYDRGHLAPAADFKFSAVAMKETFYMSNISPQKPEFNRGIWKKLEEQVRAWANTSYPIFVVTGAVNKQFLGTLPNTTRAIEIPQYFYKIVLDTAAQGRGAIAFVMKNQGSTLPLKNYVVSIDSVESLTHIDFFPQASDNQETAWEKSSSPKWKLQK